RTLELLARAESIARAENDPDLLAGTLCAIARQQYRSDPVVAKARLDEALPLLATARSRTSPETEVSCARAEAIMHELAADPQAALDVLQATYESYSRQALASHHQRGVLLNDIGNMHYKMGNPGLAINTLEQI